MEPPDRDVLLFPWCPDGGLDTEPEQCGSGLEGSGDLSDEDVLQFPWCPDGGLDAEPKPCSSGLGRSGEPSDKDVLQYPWWPDGAGSSYWSMDDDCFECKVQATEGPMCGLSASCASLEASA